MKNEEQQDISVYALEAQEQINRQNEAILEYQAQIADLQSNKLYEEQKPKRGFVLSSLSIDETRLSALIICLIGCMVFGGISYISVGDITANLTNIITALIYSIAGVNITNSVLNRFGHTETTTQVQTNNTIRPISPSNTSNMPSSNISNPRTNIVNQNIPNSNIPRQNIPNEGISSSENIIVNHSSNTPNNTPINIPSNDKRIK